MACAHLRRLAVLARELRADGGVRALVLLIDRLADVVQQAGAARELDVEPELGRHQAGEIADLDRVQQHVLRVRRAELAAGRAARTSSGCTLVQAEIEHRLLAGLLALRLDLLSCLARRPPRCASDGCARRRRAREREPRDLAAHRVEAGDDDRLGRVVDDEVDAGRRLERADVAALAADDAALQVVRRQRHHRDGALGDELAREALDRGAERCA